MRQQEKESKRTFVFLLSLILMQVALPSALLLGCSSPTLLTPEPVTLRVSGSTSLAGSLADLAAAYQAAHPYVLIDVRATDSAAGLRALSAGEADLAAVSWQDIKPAEAAGFNGAPVALDGLALIVNPANRVAGLTLLQIKALYQGATLNWSALGGPDSEPIIISREDGSGTRAAFESLVMGGERVTLNALVMPESKAVVDYVAGHPAAIGYVTAAEADARVTVLRVEDAAPTAANVKAGAYHLSRLLYLYRSPASPAAQSFIDFALSPAGQAIIARRHVPVR